MKISSVSELEIDVEEPILEGIEPQETSEEPTVDTDPTVDTVELYYIDTNTGARSLIDQPSSFTANDGTSMINGTIGIDPPLDQRQIDKLIAQGLLDKVVQFANRDPRVNIDVNSLIPDKIHQGIISFIITPVQASSRKKVIVAQKENLAVINKVCNAFFEKFNVGKDLSDFNVNSANDELYNLMEKVAVNLTSLDKKRVMKRIRDKLSEHNVKLIYLENNY